MKTLWFICLLMLVPGSLIHAQDEPDADLLQRVKHGYAENDGVKLHYATVGEGPLVVMLHGFPDYWYTWRDQMRALEDQFQVVAMDLRAYNLSGQPEGIDNYKMPLLVSDVIAVIKSLGKEKAIVVGHDWGGAIAWQLAIQHPEVVEKLIVCNMTHPTGYQHASLEALKANGNESYMDDFRKHTAETLPVTWLSGWVTDAKAKQHYVKAFQRSSVDGMLNYYRANTPTKEQRAEWLKDPQIQDLPKVAIPVLAIFGTKDRYVLAKGLNNTWDWMQKDFTLVAIPDAGHFVQQEASQMVSKSMRMWLLRDNSSNENDAGPLQEFDWIVGVWQRERQGKMLFEEWTQVSPATIEGRSFMKGENNEVQVLEDLMITSMGNEVFYIPKVAENDLPVPFKLVSRQDGHLTFENPAHDFPQRIEYKREDGGKLAVTISDMERTRSIPFQFERKQ